jgi:hypothetical protein
VRTTFLVGIFVTSGGIRTLAYYAMAIENLGTECPH